MKCRSGSLPTPVKGGSCGEGSTFVELDADAASDGFRVDVEGRVWTSAGSSVRVYAPSGALLAAVEVPEKVSNLCFGGGRRSGSLHHGHYVPVSAADLDAGHHHESNLNTAPATAIKGVNVSGSNPRSIRRQDHRLGAGRRGYRRGRPPLPAKPPPPDHRAMMKRSQEGHAVPVACSHRCRRPAHAALLHRLHRGLLRLTCYAAPGDGYGLTEMSSLRAGARRRPCTAGHANSTSLAEINQAEFSHGSPLVEKLSGSSVHLPAAEVVHLQPSTISQFPPEVVTGYE